MKYRKKPIIIEAKQLSKKTFDEVVSWIKEENLADGTSKEELTIEIITLEGNHHARCWDFVIKGVQGEFYPCKPDIFEATYEEITEK